MKFSTAKFLYKLSISLQKFNPVTEGDKQEQILDLEFLQDQYQQQGLSPTQTSWKLLVQTIGNITRSRVNYLFTSSGNYSTDLERLGSVSRAASVVAFLTAFVAMLGYQLFLCFVSFCIFLILGITTVLLYWAKFRWRVTFLFGAGLTFLIAANIFSVLAIPGVLNDYILSLFLLGIFAHTPFQVSVAITLFLIMSHVPLIIIGHLVAPRFAKTLNWIWFRQRTIPHA